MAGFRIEGDLSGNVAEVDTNGALKVALPATPGATTPLVAMVSENDDGSATNVRYFGAPETDDDSRFRIAHETIFDSETFNYTAQNTGKHTYLFSTMGNTFSAAGLTTNSANIVTANTGTSFGTYAEFPLIGASLLYCEIEGSFSAQPTTNTIIDFGMFRRALSHPFAPTDGVYFRLSSAGLQGIINSNGTETTTSIFTFPYENNEKHQFIIAMHERNVEFWIDGTLYGTIDTPIGQGQPCMSTSLPFSMRHAIVGGAAGSAISFVLNDYTISIGGPQISTLASTLGNRIYGSYQGLSGSTMGSLATYPNSTNPTAAAPSNTALTANLPSGLGGQGAVIAAAAAATDGIWASYTVPAGTANVQGRRLVLRGVRLDAVNLGAAVAGSPTVIQFSLAFGHTADSLATGEAAAAKAPRRIPMGIMSWLVGAAIGAQPQYGPLFLDLGDAPAFVNPGERVAIAGKFLSGTATPSQVINFVWTPIYGWE